MKIILLAMNLTIITNQDTLIFGGEFEHGNKYRFFVNFCEYYCDLEIFNLFKGEFFFVSKNKGDKISDSVYLGSNFRIVKNGECYYLNIKIGNKHIVDLQIKIKPIDTYYLIKNKIFLRDTLEVIDKSLSNVDYEKWRTFRNKLGKEMLKSNDLEKFYKTPIDTFKINFVKALEKTKKNEFP
jgi:hypothetical protein